MAGYVPLPAFRAGAPLDFSGLNEGLDYMLKQQERNRLLSGQREALKAVYGGGSASTQPNALLGGRPSPAAQAQASSVAGQYGRPAMSPAMGSAAAAGRDNTPDIPEIAFVKQMEGFTPNTAWDYKQNTNGYGTKALPGETTIDRGTAEERLRGEVAPIRGMLDQQVPGANTDQRAALTSAGINLGTGKGGLADFIPEAQAGDWNGVGNRLLRYNHAGGEVNSGLTTRRAQEAALVRGGGSPAPNVPPQAQANSPAPGPDFDAGIRIAAANGDVQTMALLQNAKQQAELTARQGRQDERQAGMDVQTTQLNQQRLQEGEMDITQKLAVKAAGLAQTIEAQPPEMRPQLWAKLVGSSPKIAQTLQTYGIDPADHTAGSAFLIAEARGLAADESTGDQKEYALAKRQGFPGSFMDYQTQLKRAGTKDDTPADVKTYEYDMSQRKVAGQAPVSFLDWNEERAASKRPPATATEMRAINDAEDAIPALQGTIESLNAAKALNPNTFSGLGAQTGAGIGTSGVPGAGLIVDEKKANATAEWLKLMKPEAIKNMAATLKGATTNFELDQFVEVLSDPYTPIDVRDRTIDRMMKLAQRQKQVNETRLTQMRDKTYFTKGGGGAPAPAQSGIDPRALQMLQSDPSPEAMQEFDEVFGAGAAQRALGR